MDKNKNINAFKIYTDKYDSTDTKIALKIEHTYHVAENALVIAEDLGLPGEDVDLAWFLGLLHDIGRFEQLRQYGTFLDARSVDHAEFGADILFKDGLIDEFDKYGLPADWLVLSEVAIREHNKLAVREGIDSRTRMFCDILRDADKVDIFRVIAEIPHEKRANYDNVPDRDGARDEVMQCVYEHRCVPRMFERTKFESLVSQCCMAFELVYPKSIIIVKEQEYLWQLLETKGDHSKTEMDQLAVLKDEIQKAWE